MPEQERTNGKTVKLAVIANDIGYIKSDLSSVKRDITRLHERLDTQADHYVTRAEFSPYRTDFKFYKQVLIGSVITMLISIMTAITYTVLS